MKKISESRRLASLAFLLSGLLFIVPALYAAPDKTRTAAPAKKKAATQPASAGKTNSSVVRAKNPAPVRNPRITLSDNALRDQARLSINRDDVTGEDMFVREAALNALGNHAGSVVVMNPNTGQIYSIVNQDWAVRSAFKPCSTIKLVTGLAGLSESVIDPLQAIDVWDRSEDLNLGQALAISNNGYFQAVGAQVGLTKMLEYAQRLGLGRRTGINLPGEATGRLPIGNPSFGVARMSSHGDDFTISPVQLATLMASIANGGSLVTPRVTRQNQYISYQPGRPDGLQNWTLQQMLPGLMGAVRYGTAKKAFDADNRVAGKTGSCIGQGSWLGLFTSYAPVAAPQVVVVVVTRGNKERGAVAAGIAGQVHQALKGHFFNTPNIPNAPRTAPTTRDDWASSRDSLPLRPRIIGGNRQPQPSDEEGDAVEYDETDAEAPHAAPPAPARPQPEGPSNGSVRTRRTRNN